MPSQRVVVVGAGIAGLRTAEALRAGGFGGEVLVVGAEPWPPYNRPPVSKQALAGHVGMDGLRLRVRRQAADVRWRLGTSVTDADLDARAVTLSDGSSVDADGLVVAAGLRPRRLPDGGPSAGRHVLRSWDDAVSLRPRLVPGARLVVIGAGFVGCELAAVARGLGCEVTCVDVDPLPMVGAVGALLGSQLRRRHEAHGVSFRLGVGVAELTGSDRVTGVALTDGDTVPADVVVEALGARADLPWVRGRDLDVTDGLRTDGWLRALRRDGSVVPGVVVAGDLARYPNARFDDVPRRVEHWTNATDTGRRAGAALAAHLARRDVGPGQAWAPLPSFWSDQYDLSLQAFGLPHLADADGVHVLAGRPGGEVVVGYHRGDDLVGVAGLGLLDEVMARRDAIGNAPAAALPASGE